MFLNKFWEIFNEDKNHGFHQNANFSGFPMLKQKVSKYDPERYGLQLSESYYNSLIPAVKAEEFAFW